MKERIISILIIFCIFIIGILIGIILTFIIEFPTKCFKYNSVYYWGWDGIIKHEVVENFEIYSAELVSKKQNELIFSTQAGYVEVIKISFDTYFKYLEQRGIPTNHLKEYLQRQEEKNE